MSANNPVTIVVTPYVEDGEIKSRVSREVISNKKPFFGDLFVRTDELDLKKCIFSLNRYDGKDKSHQSVCDLILHQGDGKIIRVRMGESLLISNLSGTKHIQFLMVEDRYNLGKEKLIRCFNKNIDREELTRARKFAQRQDAKLRRQPKIDERPSLRITQPDFGTRSGAPMTVKPTWWKKAINWFTSNINKVSP